MFFSALHPQLSTLQMHQTAEVQEKRILIFFSKASKLYGLSKKIQSFP